MPAPKAVLRDIAEQGLDPKVAHSRIATNGRLANALVTVQNTTKTSTVEENTKKPLQVPAMVVPAPAASTKVETAPEAEKTAPETVTEKSEAADEGDKAPEVSEEKTSETSDTSEDEVVVLASSKKLKATKKNDK